MNHDEIKNDINKNLHALGIYTLASEVLLERLRNTPDCTGTSRGSAVLTHAAGFALEEADRVMSDLKRTIASIEPMPIIEMLTYVNTPSREVWAEWIVEELAKLRKETTSNDSQ